VTPKLEQLRLVVEAAYDDGTVERLHEQAHPPRCAICGADLQDPDDDVAASLAALDDAPAFICKNHTT
jgi:hypothetical protein